MSKQTAVEWLVEQINQDYPEMTWAYKDECEQALAMEKEQIQDAIEEGENNSVDYFVPEHRIKESEQYYNETYL
jgi:hypothetical protein